MKLSAQYVREILDYQPHTGHFFWKVARKGVRGIGAKAGSIDKQRGYVQIGIDGKLYLSHRLAWLHIHGEWPAGQIDHINGQRADNRLSNLRDATSTVNNQNRRKPNKNSTTSLLGSYLDKSCGRYLASITKDRKQMHLGYYNTPEEAHAVYLAKRREIFEGNTL